MSTPGARAVGILISTVLVSGGLALGCNRPRALPAAAGSGGEHPASRPETGQKRTPVPGSGLTASQNPREIAVHFPDGSELGFRLGQIVAWRAGGEVSGSDESGLGPWPVPLDDGWEQRTDAPVGYDDPHHFASWGAIVEARQSLDEAGPARVVVSGVRRYRDGSGAAPAADDRFPQHTWRYVIYPDGRIYVTVSSEAAGRSWTAPKLGYALALNARSGLRAADSDLRTNAPAAFTFVRMVGREDQERLIWVPYRVELVRRRLELLSDDGARGAVLIGDQPAAERVSAAQMLVLSPPAQPRSSAVGVLARDYQVPATLVFDVGSASVDQAGDVNRDGFNEAEGVYELMPRDGLLRARFEPGELPRRGVRLRVHGVAQRGVSVALEGRVLRPVLIDPTSGTALFVLPMAIDAPARLEVFLGAADRDAPHSPSP